MVGPSFPRYERISGMEEVGLREGVLRMTRDRKLSRLCVQGTKSGQGPS